MVKLTNNLAMEAECMWFKADGVVVLEQCSFGFSFFGHPDDYIYDSALINYKNQLMVVYDGQMEYEWFSDEKLIVPDVFVTNFVENQLHKKSSTTVWDMIYLVQKFFKCKCTKDMSQIIIEGVKSHYNRILEPLNNYIPATIIQRTCKKCITDPGYKVCRNRLMREFGEM